MVASLETLVSNFITQKNFGGDERDRTADPLLARQVLSQLSYAPMLFDRLSSVVACSRKVVAKTRLREFYNTFCSCPTHPLLTKMVGLSGLEPLTSRLSGVRSNQLSYRPKITAV